MKPSSSRPNGTSQMRCNPSTDVDEECGENDAIMMKIVAERSRLHRLEETREPETTRNCTAAAPTVAANHSGGQQRPINGDVNSSARWEDIEMALHPDKEAKKLEQNSNHAKKVENGEKHQHQRLYFMPRTRVETGAPLYNPEAAHPIDNSQQPLTDRQRKEISEGDAIAQAMANSTEVPDGQPGAFSTVPGSKPRRRNYAPTQSVINEATCDDQDIYRSRVQAQMATSPLPESGTFAAAESNLAVANMVSERSQENMPVAQAMEAKEKKQDRENGQPYAKLGLCAVVLAIVTGVVLLLLFLVVKNQKPNDLPTTGANATIIPSTPEGYVWSLLPDYTQESIRREGSPQDLAYQWVYQDPFLRDHSTQRLRQRFGLATFYYATGGPSWTYAKDWLNYTAHECSWYLRSTFLPPTDETSSDLIPPCNEEGLFYHLWQWASKMEGTLPPEFFWITSLKTINLQKQTALQGSVPTEIGQCSHLQALTLSENDFSSLPSELGRLKALKSFSMFSTKISGTIPTQTGMMESLEHLDISNNFLKELPSELGQLKRMRAMILSENVMYSSIPTEFAELSSLESLQLFGNSLYGPLHSQLGQMKNLTTLLLDGNLLTGTIPTQLAGLSNLERLHIYGNDLTGILPTAICALPRLARPKIDCLKVECPVGCDCDCRDPDPVSAPFYPDDASGTTTAFNDTEADNVSMAEPPTDEMVPQPRPVAADLELPDYTITALWDPFSPQSKALDWLELHPLFRSYPEWKNQQLLALVTFYYSYEGQDWKDEDQEHWLSYAVDECSWRGNMCNADGKITTLSLEDQSEFVRGTTPLELAMLTSLETLDLFDMHLSAALDEILPFELTSLTSLTRARLNSNGLAWPLPFYIGGFHRLTSLQLHSQSLTGSLPTELGLLTNMRQLTLQNNFFTGHLPSELGLATALEELSVHATDITGTMPEEICALPVLNKLEVSCFRVSCVACPICTCSDEL